MKENLLSDLQTEFFAHTVYFFESIDSTNTYCKNLLLEDTPDGTLVFAEEQTAGRGRLKREWISTKGENLLFSIILYPTFSSKMIQLLPFSAALAVVDTIKEEFNIDIECKWPNDILFNKKKICGILVETVIQGTSFTKVVLGIGLNVNQKKFSEDLIMKATSLSKETAKEVDRVSLLKKILQKLEKRYKQLSFISPKIIIEEWKKYTTMLGKNILVNDGGFSFEAIALDIEYNGGLLIKTSSGEEKKIYAADVSVKV